MKVWECKIGGEGIELPDGADFEMRQAIKEAYFKLTGKDCEFCFSGWGAKLSPIELRVLDMRKENNANTRKP